MDDKFQHPTAQAAFVQDEAKSVNADVDKDLAHDQANREKILKDITDRLNYEIMDMIQYNDTFTRFIGQYLWVFFDWGADNGLEFWEVGIKGDESWFSHDGKTIMFKPCRTERNANPLTGEKKSNGLYIPGGG